MNKEQGFTIIELLLVLCIVTILTLLVIPSLSHLLKKQQTKHFFAVFESDVMFVQTQALHTVNGTRITLYKDEYLVLLNNEVKQQRDLPNHLTFISANNARIQYSNSGTILQPYTYVLKEHDTFYHIVFPFGKGRHYVVEN